MLEIKPIFHALCRSKVGAILLLIQIAITTAIVSNAAFIIQDRIAFLNQETGYPEQDLFKFNVMTFGKDVDASQQFELDEAMLRALPGVESAAQSSSIPLSGSGSASGFNLKPAPQESKNVRTAYFFIDEHGLDTYGVKLIAGRNFTEAEVLITNSPTDRTTNVTVVTGALANELFPKGDGLGKTVYFGDLPLQIIGITAPMKGPWLKDSHPNNVALIPYIQGKTYAQFAVRTKPGQRAAVMKQIENAMLNNYSKRVINNIKGLDELKDQYMAADKLMMRMLIVLITILVLVTALGIFGLTLFNINKRTKQIGTRRALGAQKICHH